MTKALAVTNQKGGVGKTTTAINLGAALASLDRRVLLVDIDPQANATSGLGVSKEGEEETVYDALRAHGSAVNVRPTNFPNLSLIASSRDLVGAEIELVQVPDREFRLSLALESVRNAYDFILIDCPPSLGLLTLNALCAADGVLVPIQCEYFALEGVSDLLRTIERVRDVFNPRLTVEGVVLTMFDERTNLARQVTQDIREHFQAKVFQTVIPRNIRLAEAPSYGKPILAYDIKSKGAEAYLDLAAEVIRRQ